jgi:hypothetical protein
LGGLRGSLDKAKEGKSLPRLGIEQGIPVEFSPVTICNFVILQECEITRSFPSNADNKDAYHASLKGAALDARATMLCLILYT